MLVLAVAAVLGAILALVFVLRKDPAKLVASAETLLAQGRKTQARARLQKAIALIDAGKGRPEQKEQTLGRACLLLASLVDAAGETARAFELYKRARSVRAPLQAEAWRALARGYAVSESVEQDALEAYIECIRIPGPPAPDEAVLAALQRAARVSEDMKPAQRRAAADVARQALAAVPGLEWAHYFAGLGTLLDGRAAEASGCFAKAQELNPERQLTYYWLAVCRLQQTEPDLEAAAAALERFLSFPSAGERNRKREAKVCAELGRRLVGSLGGLETKLDCTAGEAAATLARAIRYLRISTERQPEDAETVFSLALAYRLAKDRKQMLAAMEQAASAGAATTKYGFELGMECYRGGDLNGARDAFARLATAHPDYGEAHAWLGEICFKLGDLAAAEAPLLAALRLTGQQPRLVALLLCTLYRTGRYADAAHEVEARPGLSLDPKEFPEAILAAGRSYLRCGEFKKAETWLRRIQGRPEGRYYLGCALAHAGDFKEALPCFDALVEVADWSTRAQLQRAHILAGTQDPKRAEDAYRQVLARDPECAEAHLAFGWLAHQNGRGEEAIASLSEAVRLRPDDAQARLALAAAYERKGDYDQAIAVYGAIGANRPEAGTGALRTGMLLCRQGNFAKALQLLDECAARGDESDTLLFYRGTALAMTGALDKAIESWEKLLARYPSNERLQLNVARAHYQSGAVHAAAGRFEQALAEWERYLAQYPADRKTVQAVAELHFRCGLATLGGGDPARSRESFRAALERNPDDGTYAYYAALCDLREGNIERSRAAISGLLARRGRDPRLLYHLALCLLREGESAEAMRLLQEVRQGAGAGDYARYASLALGNERLREQRPHEATPLLAAGAFGSENFLEAMA